MDRKTLYPESIIDWRSRLPEDFKAVIPEENINVPIEELIKLADDLSPASRRQVPYIIASHGPMLAKAGRACRIRVLAWASLHVWPRNGELCRYLTNVEDAEGGEGAAGRVIVAPLFKADLDALAYVLRGRFLNASLSHNNVLNVLNGIKAFDQSHNILRKGA